MGYDTSFNGEFEVTPPLTPAQVAYINAFRDVRHMARDEAKTAKLDDPVRVAVGLPVGPKGLYYVGGYEGGHNQFSTKVWADIGIIDYNKEPADAPGLWCQWQASDDGTTIEWDEGEKFYDYVEWIVFIVTHFLKPWGCVLNGEVSWQGEESDDRGTIYAKDNEVQAVPDTIEKGKPTW